MSEIKPGWEIIEKYESDIGVHIKVRATYSDGSTLETGKNINKKRYDENRVKRKFDRWFEDNKPDESGKKLSDKDFTKNSKMKVGYKNPK